MLLQTSLILNKYFQNVIGKIHFSWKHCERYKFQIQNEYETKER